jgi:glycosyltransferase involved in cell wall biosynthesis
MPKVSVIMNCYNGEKYLKEAIDSIYAQTFPDWEIIFWDNCSTDRSAEIAKSYDTRLKYYRSDNNDRLGKARSLALAKATGEWIAFLDTDDYWFPTKLETQLIHVEYTEHIVCYAGIKEITPRGRLIRNILPAYTSGHHLSRQLAQFDINMVTPIVKKQALLEFGINFDENITASEEYNLFIRLAAKGTFCAVHEILGAWRISPGSLTDRSIKEWSEDRFYTLAQLTKENPGIYAVCGVEISQAYARGYYYKARYLRSIGEYRAGSRSLTKAVRLSSRYAVMLAIWHIPFAWGILHSRTIKRQLVPAIAKFVFNVDK